VPSTAIIHLDTDAFFASVEQRDSPELRGQTTLHEPTDDGQAIYRAASTLLLAEKLKQKVRLTGVSAQRLLSQGGQLPLFDSDRRTGRLNAALDRIHDKFGSAALTTADLHETPTKKRE
jgi:impB/mucB/samB family C-terminal domain